jgi:peptide deformylase
MERMFVMYSDVTKGEIITCFNPLIVTESDEEIMMDEGCLTYPGLWLRVKRPDGIEVIYEDENGEKQEKAMFGLTCRVFQHEYDHMQGLNFTKKVSKLRLNMAKKRLIKQRKKLMISKT